MWPRRRQNMWQPCHSSVPSSDHTNGIREYGSAAKNPSKCVLGNRGAHTSQLEIGNWRMNGVYANILNFALTYLRRALVGPRRNAELGFPPRRPLPRPLPHAPQRPRPPPRLTDMPVTTSACAALSSIAAKNAASLPVLGLTPTTLAASCFDCLFALSLA